MDATNQWAQTLEGINRQQIKHGLECVRKSGRKWPPAAPEFRAICLASAEAKIDGLEIAYAELCKFVADGRSDTHNLSAGLYHTVRNHLNLFTWRQLSTEKGLDLFRFAYRATLEQAKSGVSLQAPPDPSTLLENAPAPKTAEQIETDRITAQIARDKLKSIFEKPDAEKLPLTELELKDLERVERIKRGEK